MREIIYNESKLEDTSVNEWVRRAKLVVITSKNEILLAHTDDSYYFLGGHVEGKESDKDCLIREIKEEAGVDYTPNIEEPFVTIKYYCEDYPCDGINRCYISNYYVVYDDIEVNDNKASLTEEELKNHFRLVYIHKDNILEEITPYLEISKRSNVIRDTIDVLKELL